MTKEFWLYGYKVEEITSKTLFKYSPIIESVSYICEFSGTNPSDINLENEIHNPELPKNGKIENNHIHGITTDAGLSIGWMKYYENFNDLKTLFLGELFILRSAQSQGHGKKILVAYEKYWKQKGFTKIVLNVDLKNWIGIQFWLKNGYTKIEEYIGDEEYSVKTFAMLRLSKNL